MFAVFSGIYSILTPPFEAPDEFLHIDYINYVAKHGSLPNQFEGVKDPKLFVGQGHQHPLYYVIMAVPVKFFSASGVIAYQHPAANDKNWKGGEKNESAYANVFTNSTDRFLFYMLRFFSILFGIINLYFIYRISALVIENPLYRLIPVIIAAGLPQFQFISAVVNNDSMLNMLSTIGIYYLLIIAVSPAKARNFIAAGIVIGLAILVKKTVLFILPCAVLLLLILTLKKNAGERTQLIKHSAFFIVIVMAVSAFVFIRNYAVYGEFLAGGMEKATMPQFVQERALYSKYFISPFATGMLHSFIGVFGWMNIPVPRYIEAYFALLLAAGIISAFFVMIKSRDLKILFLYLLFAACLGGVIYFNLTFTQYQGRYMFPVLSAICVLTGIGLAKILGMFKNSAAAKYVFSAAAILIFTFDVIGVLTLYNRYY